MFAKLLLLSFAVFVISINAHPLQRESQHGMSSFFKPQIVGGVEAPPEYGKHMAALISGDTVTHFICGASIIAESTILTAAHCVHPMIFSSGLMRTFRAVIGSNKWAYTKNSINFSGYVYHADYEPSTLRNDISLVFLEEKIVLNGDAAIIPLNYDWVDGGVESYVTGWGRPGNWDNVPDELHLLYVNTIAPKQCYERIREASVGWPGMPPYDSKVEICTFHSFGHGMCIGDSGSALIQKNIQQQIGIVSWGFPCAIGAPDVFVRVSSYKDWIISNLKN